MSISLLSFCHWNLRLSPVASTVKAVGTPVTTDLLSGCCVILGGSTEEISMAEKDKVVVTCNYERID